MEYFFSRLSALFIAPSVISVSARSWRAEFAPVGIRPAGLATEPFPQYKYLIMWPKSIMAERRKKGVEKKKKTHSDLLMCQTS